MPPNRPKGAGSARRVTSTYLENLKPGKDNVEVVIDRGARGHGALILRVTDTGKPMYFRYFLGGARKLELVGHFDPCGAQQWRAGKRTNKGGPLTLAAARGGFNELARLAKSTGDLKSHFAGEEAERAAARRKAEGEQGGSFADLLNAYILSLRMENKPSWKQADGIFGRHVRKPFKALLARKANEITAEDIQAILARMVSAGITRQTNMARSFLRAAFAHGSSGHYYDPRRFAMRGKAFKPYQGNPVDAVPRIAKYDRTGQRVLSASELLFYLEKVDKMTNPMVRAFLKLHLYTGAQRVIQLLKTPWTAYDLEDRVLTIADAKGRASAREHLVPLLPEALEAIETVRPLAGDATWPFTMRGKVPLRIETVEHAVADISKALVADAAERKTTAEPFSLRDVRRTVEAALASLGIPKEVRADLLLHGRGDRISQTYDKRRALEAWRDYIEATVAGSPNVVPLRRGKPST